MCRDCGALVLLVRWQHSRAWTTFDPRSLAPREQASTASWAVEGRWAWRTQDLVEDLMVRRECSFAEALDEARDMPHHTRHVCPAADVPTQPAYEPQEAPWTG